jgi:hypothetical protein
MQMTQEAFSEMMRYPATRNSETAHMLLLPVVDYGKIHIFYSTIEAFFPHTVMPKDLEEL